MKDNFHTLALQTQNKSFNLNYSHSMQKTLLITAISFLILSFTGCKKAEIVEPLPTISFSFSQGDYGLFGFNATSTNATTYVWDFGDGGTDYTLSPTHYYKKNGSYNVSVIATGKGGTTTTNRTVSVSTVAGEVTFWSSNAPYQVDVIVDGKYQATIKSLYSSSPSCGASGCAYFVLLSEGTHTFTAKESGRLIPRTWKGNVSIVGGLCTKQQLTI